MRRFVVLLTVIGGLCVAGGVGPSSPLSAADKARLVAVFSQGCLDESDITTVYHSVLGLKLLGADVPGKEKLCAAAAKLADDSSVENLYAASGTGAALGCPVKFGAKAVEALGVSDGATTASIFFSTKAMVAAGSKVDKAVAKHLNAALKKDDSLLSLGLAFHVASLLDGDMSSVFERIEDALVQADEVDGRLLQFEGGLSVTSVVLTGASALATKLKKPLPLTGEQAVKFANYLLSRKSVQQPKGALHLLEGIESMTGNAQFTPLTVSLASSLAVSSDSPNVQISVTDLKGNSAGDLKVSVISATHVQTDKVVASNVQLKKAGDVYQLDLMALKPAAGFYELVVSAVPAKANAKIVGNKDIKLSVKVLTKMAVNNAELKVMDSDGSTEGRTMALSYPGKEGKALSLSNKKKIQLTFSVQDTVAGSKMLVHQAFVKVANLKSAAEIVYVAEADSNKVYKFELDLGSDAAEFKASGKYSLSLILGDAVVSNPISWLVADLDLELGEAAAAGEPGPFQPKPEIKHLFREPEKRPPQLVSTVFTALCLAPFLLLLLLWIKLGANISNFSFSLSTLGFHVGLGAIFTLYFYFWLQLNMFETIRYLALIGLVTFICGNSLLAGIAKKNK